MQIIRPLQKVAERRTQPTVDLREKTTRSASGEASLSVPVAQPGIPARSRRISKAEESLRDNRKRSFSVLHVGCGAHSPTRLHASFKHGTWREVRCDIDRSTNPDIVASIVDLRAHAKDGSYDAIWASHVLEHLSRTQVSQALIEFRRILTPTGFALIRSPDIETVARFILDGRITDVIYTSAAGPITPLDMLYGHDASISRGHQAMRHGTGFTEQSLGRELLAAGFPEVRTTRTKRYEVWAAAFMEEANIEGLLETLAQSDIDLRC